MGNTQSDIGEQKAYEVIRKIPILAQAYSAFRAPVYAGKKNKEQAEWSGKGMVFGWQHVEQDLPAAGNETMKHIKTAAVNATKDMVRENAGVIAVAVAGVVTFSTAIWWWASSRSEKRTRSIIREELAANEERVGLLRRRAIE